MAPHATDCPERPRGASPVPHRGSRRYLPPLWETYRRTHPVSPRSGWVIPRYRGLPNGAARWARTLIPPVDSSGTSIIPVVIVTVQSVRPFPGPVDRGSQRSRVAAGALFPPGLYRAPPQCPHPRAQRPLLTLLFQRGESDARAVWTPQPRRAGRVHDGVAHLGSNLGGALPCPLRHRG